MSNLPETLSRRFPIAIAMLVLFAGSGCLSSRFTQRRPTPRSVAGETSSPRSTPTAQAVRSEYDLSDDELAATTPVEPGAAGSVPNVPLELPEPAVSQDEAVRILRDAGGKLRPDEQGEIVGIDLSFSQVTNRQLLLLPLFPQVRELDLTGTDIDDDGLSAILESVQLESLKLKGTRLSTVGFASLSQLPALILLDASSTAVTDDGLAAAKAWTQIRYLSLNDTAVSDNGLTHLASVSTLRGLSLINTAVTKDGVKLLKQSLPDCLIVAQSDTARLMRTGSRAIIGTESGLSSVSASPELLNPVIQLAAQQPELAVHLASAYSARGQWRDAGRILEAAAVADVGNRSIHFALGEALANTGQFDVAISHFEMAVGAAAASYNVGLIQYQLSLEACEQRFATALELDPELDAAQTRLAELRQRRQQLSRDLHVAPGATSTADVMEVIPSPSIRPASRTRRALVP